MPSPQTSSSPHPDQIAQRAHALWEKRGRPQGQDIEHWLEAERQLTQERTRNGKDLDEAERRLDGLIEQKPSPARRTPDGEQL